MVFMQAKICKQFKKNTLVTKSFGEKYLAEKVSESFFKISVNYFSQNSNVVVCYSRELKQKTNAMFRDVHR